MDEPSVAKLPARGAKHFRLRGYPSHKTDADASPMMLWQIHCRQQELGLYQGREPVDFTAFHPRKHPAIAHTVGIQEVAMRPTPRTGFVGRVIVACLSFLAGAERGLTADRTVDFEREIEPILKARCVACHGPGKQRADLRLDDRMAILKGGESGPLLLPGKSAASLLMERVTAADVRRRMPPKGSPLSQAELALLRAWIDQGALVGQLSADKPSEDHWSFRPVVRPAVPVVHDASWPANSIDRFILARLEKENLAPSPDADRVTFLRRLKLDLLGLPPAPEEVAAFVGDRRPDAAAALVDRYLASPHYGERWARHWLDVVRFAESDGFETNQPRPNSWPYRDYVIAAFNSDKAYDRFVVEQLAGDAFGVEAATGFLVGGAWDRVKSPDLGLTLQQRADELHDMVSTTGSAFLGLTVGCARCHNHKFDPIAQLDYYGMKAMFAGVQHGERPLRSADEPKRRQRTEALRGMLADLERQLVPFEPLAFPRTTVFLDDHPAAAAQHLVPRRGVSAYTAGTGRGERDDPGDLARLPNLGKTYSFWNNVAGRDVISYAPRLRGRYRVWLSWSCAAVHERDACYLLDLDGDLTTRSDQSVIARVDQSKFADGSAAATGSTCWSEFRDAGTHAFTESTKIVLRGGSTDAAVTADRVLLQAEDDAERATRQTPAPYLRSTVQPLSNGERFPPIAARFVRFTVFETTQLEPCIDELEVYTAGPRPENIALASRGTKATASSSYPANPVHKLEHINDGKYGNSHSWISNEPGRGWVQLEFLRTTVIDRVVWGRDRDGQFKDRLATKYAIEVAATPGHWQRVASSDDRLPARFGIATLPTLPGLNGADRKAYSQLWARHRELNQQLRRLETVPVVYAGKFTAPEMTHRLYRGEPLQPREAVAPAGLAHFGLPVHLALDAPEQTRRLALARWITDPQHPLTARVLVNRLWQHHFGQGLVATPSDFGHNGARPSHPELLDWLASEFVASGWSIKHLQRLIVLSHTYRQASAARPEASQLDAGARLLWRFPPQRLEAEPLRDSILFVSGNLNWLMGGPGFDLFEPNTNYVKVYNSKHTFGATEWRRMVYQTKPRMQLDDTFGAFDCPDAGQIAPKRTSSTTPLQALNLLNSRFLTQQAAIFADRLRREAGGDVRSQARRGFLLALCRQPEPEELAAAAQLIRAHGLAEFCRAILNANEFLYVF